ncbi:hypothetical protein [Desulforamulus aquiferis]|uniref:Uncharacterized protein n=1 Tax=Desulforamulus aquiferis TaxID=1397668 RepID=A0AAW7ZCY8_9FIRM|nr:hypothetical protein [Desulforamulus aquiferis]MDO7787370.1 hypothetical protein [Desulforamulus aquiferis]RYD02368.1 hypothetical protein N752_23850 [Desulforamulus aquiferis]
MFNKKTIITGVTTLVFGASMVGAAYALPINKDSRQLQEPQVQMQMMSGQLNTQDVPMNNQMPAQMNQYMGQNQHMMQSNEQIDHQHMFHNNQAMRHQPKNSSSMLGSGHMGNRNMGYQNSRQNN